MSSERAFHLAPTQWQTVFRPGMRRPPIKHAKHGSLQGCMQYSELLSSGGEFESVVATL